MDLERVRDLALETGCAYSEEEPLTRHLRLGIGGVPAFYLKPDEAHAQSLFIDHYCLRILDLLGIVLDREDLRWTS